MTQVTRWVSVCFFSVSVFFSPNHSFAQNSDAQRSEIPAADRARLAAVMQEIADDPVVGDWFRMETAKALQTGLERQVQTILSTDPQAVALRKAIRPELLAITRLQRGAMLAIGGKAASGPGGNQFDVELEALRDATRNLGFSSAATADLHLYVVNSGEVNAYTYSGFSTLLDFVLFQGLRKGSTVAEIQFIGGHEFGHILGEHVMNAAVIQAVFFEAGRLLIPEEATRNAFFASHKIAGRQMFRIALGHGMDSATLDRLASRLYGATMAIAKSAGDKGLSSNFPTTARRLLQAAKGESEGGDAGDIFGKIKEFQAAMERLSRRQETMADRAGLLAVGGDVQLAMKTLASLGVGEGLNPDLIEAQLKELATFIRTDDIDPDMLESGDHPAPFYRAEALKEFAKTTDFQRLSNPFVRAVDLYLRLSKVLALTQVQAEVHDSDLTAAYMMRANRAAFTDVAAKLSEEIRKQLVSEIKSPSTVALPRWAALHKYFGDSLLAATLSPDAKDGSRQQEMLELTANPDLARPDRLFAKLVLDLAALGTPPALAAINQIRELVPMAASVDPTLALRASKVNCERAAKAPSKGKDKGASG